MSNGKQDKKKNDNDNTNTNTWLFVLLGTLGVGGLFVWVRSRAGDDASASAGSNAGAGGASGALGKTLFEVSKSIREATLIVDACTVTWRLGEASRTQLLSHRDDFFVPAIADARARGAITIDEITAHLASLLVSGCSWPPPILQQINIEDALNGKLGVFEKQAWNIAQTSGAVQLYLTIRQVVAVLAMQYRRG